MSFGRRCEESCGPLWRCPSVSVEVVLQFSRILGLCQTEHQQHAGLLRIEVTTGDKMQLVVVQLDVANDCPAPGPAAATTATPAFTASCRPSIATLVMFPSPTPATTMPLAPFLTARSMKSRPIFA